MTPPALIRLALILLNCKKMTQAFFFNSSVLFLFFFFFWCIEPSKLKAKFLFRCRVDISHVIYSITCYVFPNQTCKFSQKYRETPGKNLPLPVSHLTLKYLGFAATWNSIFLLHYSFKHQFNSSSRTLSETIGKYVLLMWRVRRLWGAIITD